MKNDRSESNRSRRAPLKPDPYVSGRAKPRRRRRPHIASGRHVGTYHAFILALMWLLPAAAGATIRFNGNAPMTTNDTFVGKGTSARGGVLLALTGAIDGATIDLESDIDGSGSWLAFSECSVTVLPHLCKVAIGRGVIRVIISGGGGSISIRATGLEVEAIVVNLTGGSGDSSFFDGSQLVLATALQDCADTARGSLRFTGTDFCMGSDGTEFYLGDGTTEYVTITSSRLKFGLVQGPEILRTASNLTTATYRPRSGVEIGIGGDATTGSLVALGGESLAKWTNSAFIITAGNILGLSTAASPPFTPGPGGVYYDTTDNEPCFYNGTNWVLFSDATTVCT